MLTSAALSGQREHGGAFYAGTWPAILAPEDTQRLRSILTDPNRRKNVTARRYLLTGMLFCGICGQPLSARPRLDGVRRYICARQPENQNCGKLARVAEPVEALVKEAVIIALDGVDLRAYMAQPAEDEGLPGRIKDDEAMLELLAQDFAQRRITRVEWFASRDPIAARLDANRSRLAKENGASAIAKWLGAGEEVRRQWDERGIDWQRAVIRSAIDCIRVMPAVKGRNTFEPSLVEITWRW
jgi:hypothetical protein